MEDKFAIALSERPDDVAMREISLKIKHVFPKTIKHLLVFFTPGYSPVTILKTAQLSLKPEVILGIQAPLLIFEDRIIEKGIVAAAINKAELRLKENLIKEDGSQDIESFMRLSLRSFPKPERFILSFIPHNHNPYNYLRGVKLSLGKIFNFAGAGYIKKHAPKNFHIINNGVGEGLANIFGSGLQLDFLRLGGFIPLGKPFRISRSMREGSIVREINGEPAVNIYKKYLGEKFENFKNALLFSHYPLGLKRGNRIDLVSVLECLDDGSLLCIGEIEENIPAHIMLFHPPTLFKSLNGLLAPIKKGRDGLTFIINSLTRKKILKDSAAEEIRLIKNRLGEESKIIGIYSDYFIFPDKTAREITFEAGSLLLSQWS